MMDRWKKLDLKDPVNIRNNHPRKQSHTRNQRAKKSDSLLKISRKNASHGASQRKNKEINGLDSSEAGLVEENLSNRHTSDNMSGSSECQSDSDLSNQDKEITEISNWAAALVLDLRPEFVNMDLDLDLRSTETAFYPEVLPISLKILDCTQTLPPEIQQSLFEADPCLAPVIIRLMELERLQGITVEKERAKVARSRLNTASTQNGNRLRKTDLPGCKKPISNDDECNCVACSSNQLVDCPNLSCICRPDTCPSTKSGQGGGSSKLPHIATSPIHPDSMSDKFQKIESINMKVSQKPTVPNKSPKTQGGPLTAKKTSCPNRKT